MYSYVFFKIKLKNISDLSSIATESRKKAWAQLALELLRTRELALERAQGARSAISRARLSAHKECWAQGRASVLLGSYHNPMKLLMCLCVSFETQDLFSSKATLLPIYTGKAC